MDRTATFVAVVHRLIMNNTKDGQVFQILLDHASIKGETLDTLTRFGEREEVRVVIQPLQVSLSELPASEKERFGLFAQVAAGGPAGEAAVEGGEPAPGAGAEGGPSEAAAVGGEEAGATPADGEGEAVPAGGDVAEPPAEPPSGQAEAEVA